MSSITYVRDKRFIRDYDFTNISCLLCDNYKFITVVNELISKISGIEPCFEGLAKATKNDNLMP
jgi:hypothetical protein